MIPARQLLRSAPRVLASSRLAAAACPAQLAFARPSVQVNAFSSLAPRLDAARFRGGPTWQRGDVVTYDELKPLTESPDDVS